MGVSSGGLNRAGCRLADALDAELGAGVDQRLGQISTGRALAVQEIAGHPVLVISDDIGHQTSYRRPERGTVGRDVIGEVDTADLREQVRAARPGQPDQRPTVGEIDHRGECVAGLRLGLESGSDVGGGCLLGEHQPLPRAGSHDQAGVGPPGRTGEPRPQRPGNRSLGRRAHAELRHPGQVDHAHRRIRFPSGGPLRCKHIVRLDRAARLPRGPGGGSQRLGRVGDQLLAFTGRVDVGQVLGDPRGDVTAVGQPHGHFGAG